MLSTNGSTGATVSVVICDKQKVLTDALETLIDREADLVLAAPSAHDPHTVVQVCGDQRPDVALIDIRYPAGATTGIDATRVIKIASPRTKVVLMTGEPEQSVVLEAAEAGASAVFDKSAGADVLIETLRTTGRGQTVLDLAKTDVVRESAPLRQARSSLDVLSAREGEILGLLADGQRVPVIAMRLYLSPSTVQTHVRNILRKLGVRSQLEAVAIAFRARSS